MSNILPFKPRDTKPSAKSKANDKAKRTTRSGQTKNGKGAALCANNHHKWKVCKAQRFDTMHGKLVTVEACERCGLRRNLLT